MRRVIATACWMIVSASGAALLDQQALAQQAAPAPVGPHDRVAAIVAPLVDEQTMAVVHVDMMAFDVTAAIDALAQGFQLSEEDRDHLQVQFAPIQVVTQGLPETASVDTILVISLADVARLPFFLVLPIDKTTPTAAIALEAQRTIEESWRQQVASESIGQTLITAAPATIERLKKVRPVARPEIASALQATGPSGLTVAVVPSAGLRKLAESLAPRLPERLGGGPTGVFTRGIVWASIGVDLPPKAIKVRVVLQSADAEAAKLLEAEIRKLVAAIGELPQVKAANAKFDEFAKRLLPAAQGDRLTLELTEEDGGLDALTVVLPILVRSLSGSFGGARGGDAP